MTEKEWISIMAPLAIAAQKKFGYLASVLIAQACLENGYGMDPDCEVLTEANNVLGMKKKLLNSTWESDYWHGDFITKKTPEWDEGLRYIDDDFRKYASLQDCFFDYCQFMRDARYSKDGSYKYRDVLSMTNPETLISTVAGRGYCTDPDYPKSVMAIIKKHDLTQYDTKNEIVIADGNKITDRIIHDITKANLSEVPRNRGNNKIEFIVVHYLGVPNADNPNLYGGGYGGHYNIKRDGSVYKAADPKTAVVWHCGGGLQGSGGHSFYQLCTNFNSIGIECGVCYTENVKDASGDSDKWYFTTETQESLVWLVSSLMDEYGISADHVIRHYDVTGKICPNPYVKNNRLKTSWTWDEFKTRLSEYRKTGGYTSDGTSAATKPEKWYRIRKSWSDASSQIGAYTELENAKAAADEHPGYTVYDWYGKVMYAPAAKTEIPFLVRVSIDDLNIRTGPGTDHKKIGKYTGKGVFTIMEVKSGKGSTAGWGRLKSGAGWISLDYCKNL